MFCFRLAMAAVVSVSMATTVAGVVLKVSISITQVTLSATRKYFSPA